jgi:hypothetical protein
VSGRYATAASRDVEAVDALYVQLGRLICCWVASRIWDDGRLDELLFRVVWKVVAIVDATL